jgi:hypothetical protein
MNKFMAMRKLFLAIGAIAVLTSCGEEVEVPSVRSVVSFPEKIDSSCRNGKAKLFDECGDQLALYNAALARADAEGKVLLVSYGAEWCIWCHVLDAHLEGARRKFRYTFGSADEPDARETATIFELDDQDAVHADRLNQLVSTSFVIVHIDSQFAPNGLTVLESTGADQLTIDWIPFVFAVNKSGRYVASLDHDAVEKRREGTNWYRGYNRQKLIDQLVRLRDAATRTGV